MSETSHAFAKNNHELNAIIKQSSVLRRGGYKTIKRLRSIISKEDEAALWKKFYELTTVNNNRELARKLYNYLFCIYFRNINFLAAKAYKNIPAYSLVSWNDVIMSCFHGHIEAFNKYDPYRGISYFSFAANRVYYSVVDFVRNVQDVPSYIPALRRKIIPRLQELAHKNNRQITDDDIYDLIASDKSLELEKHDVDVSNPDVLRLIKIRTFNETNSCLSGINDDFNSSIIDNKIITINESSNHNKRFNYLKLLSFINDEDIKFAVLATHFWNMPLTDTANILEVSHAKAHGLKERGLSMFKSHFGSKYSMFEFMDEHCYEEHYE